MKHASYIIGIVVIAYALMTSYSNNIVFADSYCDIKEVSAGEKPENGCIVCGKGVDSKGKRVEVEHEGKSIPFCCEGCANAYKKEPGKYSESEKPKQSYREKPKKKKRKQRGEGYY
ncbi:MAG: hypothetical protein ACE5KZ_02605 [Candidatus Scalinduaceae bacterium]